MSKLFHKNGDKFHVQVTVKTVVLKKVGGLDKEGKTVSQALERGKKLSTGQEKPLQLLPNGDAMVDFQSESLKVDATLYYDGNDYAEKVARVLIRRKKKGFMGATYQVVGCATIPIYNLVHEEMPTEKRQLLENCIYPGSSIEYIIDIHSVDDALSSSISSKQSNVDKPHTANAQKPSANSVGQTKMTSSSDDNTHSNQSADSSNDKMKNVNSYIATGGKPNVEEVVNLSLTK
jgi:hypothetical protein